MNGEAIVGAAIAWPFALALGVRIGIYLERHKETTMDVTDRFAVRVRAWYDKWAPTFFVITVVLAVVGIGLGYSSLKADSRQDRVADAAAAERDQEIRQLLRCFDKFAKKSSEVSKVVREKAVKVDKATTLRDDALNAEGVAFKKLVDGIVRDNLTADQFQHLRATLEVRAEAGRKLDKAQDALDRARELNPVPKPPSGFCNIKP